MSNTFLNHRTVELEAALCSIESKVGQTPYLFDSKALD